MSNNIAIFDQKMGVSEGIFAYPNLLTKFAKIKLKIKVNCQTFETLMFLALKSLALDFH